MARFYLPKHEDFQNAPNGAYQGEYLFYRDRTGKIIFGEMVGLSGYGTKEGDFEKLPEEDEFQFFIDIYCIFSLALKPKPKSHWSEVIKSLRIESNTMEPFTNWSYLKATGNRSIPHLAFFMIKNRSRFEVGTIWDPHDFFADMFFDFQIQLDLCFANVPKRTSSRIEKRLKFYAHLIG